MRVDWKKKKSNKGNGEIGNRVFFSDEKKFYLDGPDGSQCYWLDLRKKQKLYLKSLFRGGSVMVWGASFASGKADLVVMVGKQNSARYVNVLGKKRLTIYESSIHQLYHFSTGQYTHTHF